MPRLLCLGGLVVAGLIFLLFTVDLVMTILGMGAILVPELPHGCRLHRLLRDAGVLGLGFAQRTQVGSALHSLH